jgi:hypothetical protein
VHPAFDGFPMPRPAIFTASAWNLSSRLCSNYRAIKYLCVHGTPLAGAVPKVVRSYWIDTSLI